MAKHKNRNDAVGNNCIYRVDIWQRVFKYGKADENRMTKSSGLPTRIHQQRRELIKKHGKNAVDVDIILSLPQTSTKYSKEVENRILQNHFDRTGEVPEENRKSFKPKSKKDDHNNKNNLKKL